MPEAVSSSGESEAMRTGRILQAVGRALVCIALALSACAGGTDEAAPARSILYQVGDGSDSALYFIAPDGGSPRRLDLAGNVFDASQSFSGDRIAFRTDGEAPELVVANTDGSSRRGLRVDGLEPAWAPDGRRIAFTGWNPRAEVPGIWTIRPDGSESLALMKPPATTLDALELHDGNADWSPDSSRLVFTRSERIADGGARLGIWTMRPDGSDQKRISDEVGGSDPDWSPQGRIVFIRMGVDRGSLVSEVWTMEPDGSDLQRVRSFPPDLVVESPVWSPDGMQIAFLQTDDSGNSGLDENVPPIPRDIGVMDADGGDLRLLPTTHDVRSISW